MLAAVTRGSGGLVLDEVPDPSPLPDEVVIDVLGCGICGSDLHIGSHLAPLGTALGHEIAGVITQTGSEVAASDFKLGTRVAVRPFSGCGTCRWCRSERADHCPQFAFHGMARHGGFAERMSVQARELFLLPSRVTALEQALVEPLAVARHALRRTGPLQGEDVVIMGAGPIGLGVVAWAKRLGASRIVVSEPSSSRRQLAEALGADVALDPRTQPTGEACREALGGSPSVVVECSGQAGLIQQGLDLIEIGGRLTVVGICLTSDSITPWSALSKEVDVRFAVYYDRDDFLATIAALSDGELGSVDAMVTDTVDLQGLPERFAQLQEDPGAGKVIVTPA